MSGFNPNFPTGQGQQQGMYGNNAGLNPNANMRTTQQMGSSPNLATIQAFPPQMSQGGGGGGGGLHFNPSHLQQLSEYHNRQPRPVMPQQPPNQVQAPYQQHQQQQQQRPGPSSQFGSSYNVNSGNFGIGSNTSANGQGHFGPTLQPQQQQQLSKYTPQQQQQVLARIQQAQMIQAARLAAQQQGRTQSQSQSQADQQGQQSHPHSLRAGSFSASPMAGTAPLPIQAQATAAPSQANMQRSSSNASLAMQMQRTFSNQSSGGGPGGASSQQRQHLPISGYQPNMSGYTPSIQNQGQGSSQGPSPFAFSLPGGNGPNMGQGGPSPNHLNIPLTQHIDPSVLAAFGVSSGSGTGTGTPAPGPSGVGATTTRRGSLAASAAESETTAPSPADSRPTRPTSAAGPSTGAGTPNPSVTGQGPEGNKAPAGDQPPKKKRKKIDKEKEKEKDKDVGPSASAPVPAAKHDSSSFTKPPRGKKEEKPLPVVYFAGIEPVKAKDAEKEKEKEKEAAAAAAAARTDKPAGPGPSRDVTMERVGAPAGGTPQPSGIAARPVPSVLVPAASAAAPSASGSFNGSMVKPVLGLHTQGSYSAYSAAVKQDQWAVDRERERRRGNTEGMRGSMRNEIARLMYAAGDVPEPNVDAVDYVEDLLVEFLSDLCRPSPPVRAHPGAIYTQPPLTTQLISDRLSRPSQPALHKYKLRFESLLVSDAEIVHARASAKLDQNYTEVAVSVGAKYLGLDENGAEVAHTGARTGAGRRGRPKKERVGDNNDSVPPGERRKPGPKKGWKRNNQDGSAGTGGGQQKKGFKKRTIRDRSGTAGVKGEGG